jgi:hypothetical protein
MRTWMQVLGVGGCLVISGCSMLGGMGGGAGAAEPPSKREQILAGGGGIEADKISEPYVKACDEYLKLADPKVRGALDAIAGKSKNQMGQPHEQASALLGKLAKENAGARVDVPERGFPTVKTAFIDQITAMNTAAGPKDPKKQMELGQKLAKTQPMVLAMNAHLYEIYMAYNETGVYAQVASAYPLAAAVAMGNAARQGLIADDKEQMKKEVRRIIQASHKVQAQGATIMGLYAEYQAAVASAVTPSALDDAVVAAKSSLDTPAPVTDAEVDEVMQIAGKAVAASAEKEEELKKLAEKTMRPSPGPASGTDGPVKSVEKGDAASSVLGLLGSIASGNIMGIVQNAAKLVPEDNPLGAAIAGAAAITRGDFKKALDSASKIAPGTPIGKAIATANQVTKDVSGAVASVKR